MSSLDRDITDIVSKKDSYCLNEQTAHPIANLFQGDDLLYLASDADAQLMIHLNFTETVKITSLNFGAPSDGRAPLNVKLFANKINIGFGDVEDIKPTQTLELGEADFCEDSVTDLRSVKFQKVNSLTLFVDDNAGDEESTCISHLRINGVPCQGTDMNALKKVG